MKFKSLVAASVALSLSATGALAAPAAPTAVPEPAVETVEGDALYRTGVLVPLAAAVALALIIYLLIDSVGGGDDEPASP